MEHLRRPLIVAAVALPLGYEIIKRGWLAVWAVRVASVRFLVAALIPSSKFFTSPVRDGFMVQLNPSQQNTEPSDLLDLVSERYATGTLKDVEEGTI
jgi:hypothetical protein